MDWPLDLPARAVLELPGETAIPWAMFDAAWYRRAYHPETIENPRDLLAYYLEIGQQRGHSPNPFFDETWHQAVYPQIAAAVAAGDYASAFDAYCRRGSVDRSAHWLFDELYYRDRHLDLTPDVFRTSDIANGYDHYLRHGVHEDRPAHPLFDPATYLANFDASDIPSIREAGVFQHYLMRLENGDPELPTSAYFDPHWYRQRYPEVAEAISAGRWKSALHHYLCNDTPTAFDPLEHFSESHYLGNDAGLRQVVASRQFRNGYLHFLRFGARELRAPTPHFDLGWYAGQPGVQDAIESGQSPDAFSHWLTFGRAGNLRQSRPENQQIGVDQASFLAQRMATSLTPLAGRFGYHFDSADEPVVSVVMIVRDAFATTMATIGSLRASTTLAVELIIVDIASCDETRAVGPYVPGAKILRLDIETTWAQAAAAGRQLASARFILLLSGAVQVALGSIDRAYHRLHRDESVGAVGALILQPHGLIAQAGGIVWQDGTVHDYMADAASLVPEANFSRVVDFCAPSCLLVRAELLTSIDGTDQADSAEQATIDLCLKIAAAGSKVVYDPSVIINEMLPAASRTPLPPAFLTQHATALAERFSPGSATQVFARHAGPRQPRILFIEDTIPLRRIGSGFVRSNDVVASMAAQGAMVTIFPINGSTHPIARIFGDLPDTVEVMYDQDVKGLEGFLKSRADYYDVIWVARSHNLEKINPTLARLPPEVASRARLILDTEALVPFRDALWATLQGEAYDPEPAMLALRTLAEPCAAVVAVTPYETSILEQFDFPTVVTVGHAITPRPTLRSFDQRTGMLFVGAIHTQESPNLDSLVWFVDNVMPLIEEELGWETRLTIAGYLAPAISLERFADHPRITLRGSLPKLDTLYNSSRVFIAPTRYAAGAPYKVLEAASRGVPIVCTDLLAQQLGWSNEEDVVTADPADPAGFAAAVLSVYRDEILWRKLREGAIRRLRRDQGWAPFNHAIKRTLSAGLS